MNYDYKTTTNHFNIENNIVKMTILNKKGKSLTALFDIEDLDKVKDFGIWFAEWNKDFNQYLAQCAKQELIKGKMKYKKYSLQSVILGTSPNAPICHLNGDVLDNRKENLEIYNRYQMNEFIVLENDVISVFLKDRYGNVEAKALISKQDFDRVITPEYTWICQKRSNGQPYAIAHTKEGRVYLDSYLTNCQKGYRVAHLNKNPLDNRRQNLEVYKLESLNDSEVKNSSK